MQRKKPPQDHTSGAAVPASMTLRVIGHVRSPYKERFGTPRQATVTRQTLGDTAQAASLELLPEFTPALKDLAGFEYIWALCWLHLNEHWKPQVVPPRGPKVARGLFATRAPHRPNPIGLSALQVISVKGRVIHVHGIDFLDGTPVLDIKPYVPYADAFPDARAGWLDEIPDAPNGPDRWQ
ncbi:MAG: tRNA (N6-threonylcarbamoyladenosine(37)-N6)-methyltransferase TrmO [Planctomycetes bacterium]|nr:tRNA (N6-threonylcarbamoyladenosine(37)-N6)-methyltransferase TrmO [Planctomycetota bacterium]